jgi:alkylhydroperoxidase family enzyme
MDRIRPLGRDEAREDVRRYFDDDMERYGMVLNTTQVFAHSPELMRGARGLSTGVAKAGRIPAGLRALLCVRVATQVGCPF